MRRFMLCLFLLLSMFNFVGYSFAGGTYALTHKIFENSYLKILMREEMSSWLCISTKVIYGVYEEIPSLQKSINKEAITPMEALDKVKKLYASNFLKVNDGETGEYYYKLPEADYYLVFEGFESNEEYYLMHLYEFVLDEPETGIGHTVTYGWYTLDKNTGEIKDNTQ